ncbi:hypothetical protein EK21DRAFT_94848 [Setomelanomma holmii]|uniref:Uncharacterized protein n=1 Tax=Setomelanomma holmii TaxID=210430 RepID=A0A9P4GXH9_9PLEO|nr:hypothetical protein EK21DRAFT_94848 [Setomelanomma holmii]
MRAVGDKRRADCVHPYELVRWANSFPPDMHDVSCRPHAFAGGNSAPLKQPRQLALDGGGVRDLPALTILEQLMAPKRRVRRALAGKWRSADIQQAASFLG